MKFSAFGQLQNAFARAIPPWSAANLDESWAANDSYLLAFIYLWRYLPACVYAIDAHVISVKTQDLHTYARAVAYAKRFTRIM